MGLEIDRIDFTDAERARFDARLQASLRALADVLAREGFGAGPPTIGAECELDLVDDDARPAPCNQDVLARVDDPRLVCEVDRFNLEINARPQPLAGAPFATLRGELDETLAVAGRAAATVGARVVTIGILPTLRARDLTFDALTDKKRYRALSAALKRQRNAPFALDVEGADRLRLAVDEVTYEGANTSFQVHLKVPPARFGATYNAAQLATAPALAVAVNAPLFLGHRLWDETRIALFRQSVDDRIDAVADDWRPSRVSFGHGFVRTGAFELFAESVALHAPLLPVCGDEDPAAVVARGGVPALAELRLHHGTVWRWNRAVYDDQDGGHLRVEFRALPSGPTAVDMSANAAFMLGLTLAWREEIDALLAGLTFTVARRNFYAAARHGLAATLVFPPSVGARAVEIPVTKLVDDLLEVAYRGLVDHGVSAHDARAALDVIADRVARGQTGAAWQRKVFDDLRRTSSVDEASAALVERYLAWSARGAPVHTWEVA